uniref:Glycosyl hydrolase n=1 Tax=viral metagenome TaxID=1070528 RepID=A0A6M3K9J3_9ZZZZ
MKWNKLGRVHYTHNDSYWAYSHDFVPTVDIVDNIFKVYVGHFDTNGVKRVGLIELNADNPIEIIRVSDKPILDIGEPGTFDDSGVMPSHIYTHPNSIKHLYYFGWQLLVRISRYVFTGLAISIDGGKTFKRYQQTPILDRLPFERFIRSAPFVLKDGDIYRCWYSSSNNLLDIHGHLVPSYDIRHATSLDGIVWGEGTVCIKIENPEEFAMTRPCVIKEDNIYKMFYSIRKIDKGYRMGYAESNNGLDWIRKDNEVGIDISQSGWDSEMVCFPSIVDYRDNRYMFYNGNNYGESGFGVAVLEKETSNDS